MRLRLRAAGLLALAAVAITCTDAPTGLRSNATAALRHLQMAPSFTPEAAQVYNTLAQAFGIDVTEVHVHLVGSGGTVRDTVIAFPVGVDTLVLDIPVPPGANDEPFNALIELRNDAHTVLFSGTQTVTAHAANLPGISTPVVTINYSGPGKGTKTISITPPDTTVGALASLNYSATAIDSSGKPVTDLLVRWSTSDPTMAATNQVGNAAATISGTGKRGTVTVTATTPQGVAGTARLVLVPAPAKVVAISGGGQTASAGSVLPQPFVVEVQATDNLPVPGATVAFSAVTAGGSVQTATVVADANGRASAQLTLGKTAGTYQFMASSGALTPATVSETATPAPPSAIAVVSGNAQVDSTGQKLALPLVVKVSDQFGGAVGGATVTWTRSAGSGNVAAATTTTASDGTSSNTYTLGNVAGADTIKATVAGVSAPAVFGARTIARGAASLAIVQGGTQTGVAGSALPVALIAQLKDALGNVVSGATVAWSAAPAGVTFAPASSATNAAGQATTIATLGATAGAFTVSATSGTLSATTTLTATPGSAASITKVAGDGQTATAGTAVAVAPSVVVKDANGNVVSGAAVTFAVASGGGSVTASTATTNASGVATVGSWTLGTTAGANTLTATSGALTTTFGATGVPASASKLVLLQGLPNTITVGAAFAAPVTVQIADANGNPVALAGVTVTATANVIPAPPNGAPSITATTNAAGVATFNIPPYVGPVGVVTFTASATGLTSVSSAQIPIVAGPAAQLLLAVQPSATATLGVKFPTQPSVQLGDVFGNPVTVAGVSVTAAIGSGGGTLGGTATVATNASGVAAYSDLSISGTAATRTLQFSSGSLAAVVSNAVAVSVGAPASLTKTAGDNQTANAGSAVTVAPTVVVRDALGNVVPGATVTFAVASGGGSVTGATATTDASGVASVGSWTLGSAAGTNTLTATSGTASATFTATGVSVVGTQIVLVSGVPASITVGAPFAAPLVVRIADAQGNPVAQQGVLMLLTGTLNPGNISSPLDTVRTDATGTATFVRPPYVGKVGTITATVSAPGLTSYTSPAVPVLTGAAAQLVITTAPSSSVVSGSALAQQPVVQLADVGGNPVSTAGVDVNASSPNATIGGTTTVKTNASGAAVFTDLAVTSSNSQVNLVFGSAGLSATGAVISVSPASGSLVFSGGWNPGATVAFKPFNPQPKIQLLDQGGNPVRQAGISVVAGIFAGPSGVQNIQNPSVFTDAQGIATFTNLIIGGNPGTYTMQFLAGNTASGLTFPPLRFDVQLTAGGPASIVNNGFTNGAQTVVGGTTTQQPSVKVTDQFGSPSVGANVVFTANTPGETITANGVTGTSLTVATDASGIASLNAWRIGTNAQSYQVQASVAGVSAPVVFTTNGVAGAQAGFTAVSIPTSITVGAAITPLKVQLVDINGNPVALANVNVTATGTVSPSGATFGGTVTTDGAGIATFPLPPYTGQTGSGVLVFSSPGLASLTSASIPIVAGAATNLQVVTQPSSSVTSGVTFPTQPTVRLIDAGGNVVNTPNVSITAFLIFGTGTLTGTTALNTNASGVVNFTNLAITGSGTHQIQFTPTPGQSQAIMNIISANANAMTVSGASSMIISAGAGQTAVVASTTAVDPAVKVLDANGVGVPNVSVTFTPRGGSAANGSPSPATVTTNASGIASVSWIMGHIAGTLADTMDVTSAGLPALKFVASATAQQGINVIISQQPPSSVTSGSVISPAIVVQYIDSYGNPSAPVPAQTFTALIGTGSGTLSGTTQVTTNSSGTATFSNLILSGTAGTYSLNFFDGHSATFPTNSFTLTAGAPTQVGFVSPWTPGSTGAGVAFATQPVIQLQDANGNAVKQANVTVTAVVNSISVPLTVPVTIQNNTAVTNANGTATFSGLVVGGNAGNWILAFSAPGTSNLNSGSLQIVAGPASSFAINAGNSQSTTVGTAVPIPPSIVVVDAYGNGVSGVNVTWTANNGSALTNLTGTNGTTFTIPTNASGISSVGSWIMGSAAQVYTLNAAGSVSGSPKLFNATATAGAASGLKFIQQPSNSVGGTAITPTVQVALVDGAGNTVTSASGSIALSITNGTGTSSAALTNASATTVNGVASFPNLTVDIGGNGYTLTASSGTFAPLVSTAFNVSPGQFGLITTKAGTRQSVDPVGTTNPSTRPIFVLRNANNTVLPNKSVTLTAFGRCLLDNGVQLVSTLNLTTDVNGEVTPLVRLPSASIGSGCSIFATAPTLTSARDSALIAVYPSGRTTTPTHVWMGTANTNWSTAANWVRPGATPAAPGSTSDIVFVPAFVGAIANYPTLNSVHPSILRLQMDTAAVIVLNGNILDVGGSSTIGGVAGFGLLVNGTTRLTGNGTLNGVFDKIEVGVSGACANMIGVLARASSSQMDMYCATRVDTVASVSTDLTVHPSGGGLTLLNTSAAVAVNGNALFTGDSLIAQGGTIINVLGTATFGGTTVRVGSASIQVNGAANFVGINSANYTSTSILVQGKATFGAANAGPQNFSGGTMTLLGDFDAVSGFSIGPTYVSTNDQTIQFTGSGTQTVTATSSATRFQQITILNNTGGVTFAGSLGNANGTGFPRMQIGGKLTLAANRTFTEQGAFQFLAGSSLTLQAGSTFSISGSCSGASLSPKPTVSGTGSFLLNQQPYAAANCP